MRTIISISLLLLPLSVRAQVNPPEDFRSIVDILLGLIGLIVPLLFTIALLVFLWGIANAWIIGGGDSASVEKGKKIALAGIIGLIVMSAVWGIVALIRASLF